LTIEGNILLIKLVYSQGRLSEVNKLFSVEKLQSQMNDHINKMKNQLMPEIDSLRQLQLLAEAHSIRGLCLEKRKQNKGLITVNIGSTLITNEHEKEINEQDIIDSYETSSHFAIEHSIAIQKKFPSMVNNLSNSQFPSTTITSSNNIIPSIVNENSLTSNINSLSILNNVEENIDLINPLYEIALQKVPLLYIKRGFAKNL
jgi:hypothetical protein